MEGQVTTVKESQRARGTHELSSPEGGGQVRTAKPSKRARDTHVLSSKGGVTVMSAKESQRARGTHSLSGVDGGTSQDGERKSASEGREINQNNERKPAREGHSRPIPVEYRGRNNLKSE